MRAMKGLIYKLLMPLQIILQLRELIQAGAKKISIHTLRIRRIIPIFLTALSCNTLEA